ncbi:putative 3 -bisphosphate nucleotidase protein [Eutypa lata UCREL1]|uniref:Putative 3-bisphosphate nucleotidase protein n=1 Tax=Eutypa lata (strain UCR-EL1) TaxID=1287681 RepID=M7SVX2_EUTLA|nr:putative 3 -bisphosphate nucleotidase protein [Eutypa lata UCREL1]
MDSPYSRELEVAFGALQKAAKISRSVLAEADLGVLAKDDLSPVTIADFAIQALLTATFHAAFPDDKFVGEESAAELRENPTLLARVWGHLRRDAGEDEDGIPDSPEQACEMIDWCGAGVPGGAGSGRVWVFDPIDGTQNFVHGGLYAINVALLEDGKQVLSAVGCPNLALDAQAPVLDSSLDPDGRGCIAFAVRGHGTHVRSLLAEGSSDETPITIRTIPQHAETARDLQSVTSMSALASGLEDLHAAAAAQLQMPFPGCNLLPWVLRYVVMGLGLANTTFWVYVSRGRLAKTWDHAGAMLLFEEVGGKITDVDGRPIDLTAGRKLSANYGFVAAPGNLHDRVLRTLQDVVRKDGRIAIAGPGA